MVYFVCGLVAFLGAVIQATMGFGGAMLLMNIMPFFFPLGKAVSLVQGSVISLNIVYSIVYWKKINWAVLTPALVPAVALGLVFSFVSVASTSAFLSVALGALFVFLSFYYILVVDKLHIAPSRLGGVVMGSLSGITNALFGMAGPPIALYLAPSLDDKVEYFATSQAFFLFCSITCVAVRLFSGLYSASDIPFLLFLVALFLLGSLLGVKVLKKVDSKALRKFIYAFIGFNGIYIIVKNLI